MPVQQPLLPDLLARLEAAGADQDLRVGAPAGVVLRWRDGHVAAAEGAFDAVARLLAGGGQPDEVAAALAGRPAGLDGLALLALLAGADVTRDAAELTAQAAADLLAAEPAPAESATPGPVEVDLGIAGGELVDLASARLAALAALERVTGPGAVPRLTGATLPGPGAAGHLPAALAARIDGRRTVADLAAASGHTTFEVARALTTLAEAGAVTIIPAPTPWPNAVAAEPPAAAEAHAALTAFHSETPETPPAQEEVAEPEPEGAPAQPGEAHAALTAFQTETPEAPPATDEVPAPEPEPEAEGPGEGDSGEGEPAPTGDVGAAWRELRGVLAGDDPAPAPDPEPEPEADQEPEPEVVPEPAPAPVRAAGDVDSSALLRELASFHLGDEEEDEERAERPVAPVRARPQAQAAEDKGKGGRFGFRRGGRR